MSKLKTYQELKEIRDSLRKPKKKEVVKKPRVNPIKFLTLLIAIPLSILALFPVSLGIVGIILLMWIRDVIRMR